MIYDFDKMTDRSNTDCSKWEPECYSSVLGEGDLLPFWVADMDFKSPQPVIDALINRAQHGVYGYSFRNDTYFEAVVDWQKRKHGYDVSKESIVYTPGVVPAIAYAIETFTGEGDKIVIQNPVYYPFEIAIKLNNRIIVDNTLILDNGRYKINFEQLEKQLSDERVKLFILCNPHNPTGRVFSKEELTKIGDLCIKHNVLVIADEIHNDLVYKGYKHTVFASISKKFEQISITCTSPSKTFNMAGLYASNIFIANKELREQYNKTLGRYFVVGQSPFSILALRTAYNYGEEWLCQLLDYLEGNILFMEEYLSKHLPKVKLIKPEGTYLGWLDFREYQDVNIYEKVLKEAKVGLYKGEKFGTGGEGFMRICFGCPRRLLEEAFERIKRVLENE